MDLGPGYTNANISELTGFCPYLPPVSMLTEQYYKSPVVSIVSNVIPRTFIPFGIGYSVLSYRVDPTNAPERA